MKTINKIIIPTLFLVVLVFSCNSEQSLQKYYVDSENDANFISLTIPASVLQLNETVTEEQQETLNSLKKLNVLAFKIDDKNKDEFNIENEKIKGILKANKYIELMRVNHDNIHLVVKYLGEDDEMDEVILFASDKGKGFVVIRVLGEKMRPDKIIKLLQNMDNMNKDNAAFDQIKNLFGDSI